MRSFLRVADAFMDLMIPFYLIVVSLLLAVPALNESDRQWFTFEFMPSFFDANAKLIIVLPLVLFSIGLGVKHFRLVWSERLPRRLWAISVIGAGCSLLIVSIVYFTMRIDAFWLNIPSMTAYIFVRFSDNSFQNQGSRLVNFIEFIGANARLATSAICLYLALFLVLATGIRFELVNQNTDFLESQMKLHTKNLITTYQNQNECFGNEVSYRTNLLFQVLVLVQPFDEQCAGSVALANALDTVRQMIASGKEVDVGTLQALAALTVQFAGRGMDEVTAAQFDAVFQGAPDADRLCTSDGRFCIVRTSSD